MTFPSSHHAPIDRHDPTIQWLLSGDPAIRWQVLRDLLDASADEVAAERDRVGGEGWGARLLADQAADGTWAGAAWNHGWNSTMHALTLLQVFGLDPASDAAQRAITHVRDHVTWGDCGPEECHDNPYFAGEIEPCINGQVAAAGAYFGQDVGSIITRLLSEQLDDGGWNCDAERGSTRSSFNTTICVLEALLAWEQSGAAAPAVTAARLRGEAYLLDRHLFKRLSTGEPITQDRKGDTDFTRFAFPTWWHYDVLRGLDYFRQANSAPDPYLADAISLLISRRNADGRWPLDHSYPGVMPVDLGETVGQPSRWNTLRALRVLRWYGVQE